MKSNEVFEVQVNGQHIAYVEAPGKPQARMLALKHVTVTKLAGTRVAQIIRDGKAILSDADYHPTAPELLDGVASGQVPPPEAE